MTLSGFPEFLPAQRFVELEVIDRLRRVFELHGFAPVETRAAEPLEQLLRKGEIDKEVYALRRLQGGDDDTSSASSLGLHFDLTVPFARYVLENAGKLEFPFRRYQIQKVWRGERPQEGRYREFTQADIDVVAKDELPFHHDVQVARVMAEALSSLDVLPPIRMQVNNRRLIEGFYRGLGAPEPARVMQVVDKLDKLPPEQISALLRSDAGLSGDQAAQTLALAQIRTPDTSFVEQVRSLGVTNDVLDQGLDELAAVISGCASATSDRLTVEADLSIARGLDYYTGTVFETRMAGFEKLGSICSGGRYESLASDGRTTYPGVGISFGLTRALVPLFQRGGLEGSRSVPTVVVVVVNNRDRAPSERIAEQLRARGVPALTSDKQNKVDQQLKAARRMGIPYAWLLPDDRSPHDRVLDLAGNETVEANVLDWEPADALRSPTYRRHTIPTEESTS